MLNVLSNAQNAGVVCPQKESNVSRAGWGLSSFKADLFLSRKGAMTFFTYLIMVSSFDQ